MNWRLAVWATHFQVLSVISLARPNSLVYLGARCACFQRFCNLTHRHGLIDPSREADVELSQRSFDPRLAQKFNSVGPHPTNHGVLIPLYHDDSFDTRAWWEANVFLLPTTITSERVYSIKSQNLVLPWRANPFSGCLAHNNLQRCKNH